MCIYNCFRYMRIEYFMTVYTKMHRVWYLRDDPRVVAQGVGFEHGVSRYEEPSMSVSIIHPLPATERYKMYPGCAEGPL